MVIIAEYLTHQIQKGETLQQIATEKLNNINLWTNLVELNDLHFPYLVKTEKEKERDPSHLLAPGDILRLPRTNNINRDLLSQADINTGQGKHVYDSILGMDLDLGFGQGPDNNRASGDNYGDQVAYLRVNDKGTDLNRVSGVHNLLQSLAMRLITQEGSLAYHPYFGSRLNRFIGQPVHSESAGSLRMDIVNEIKRAVKTDGRIKDVKVPYCELYDEDFFAEVVIYPIAPYSAFQMLVDSINGNQINVNSNFRAIKNTEMK